MRRPDLEVLQQLARRDDWHLSLVGSNIREVIVYALQAEADRETLAAGLDAISNVLDGMIEGASREETKEALYTAAVKAWDTAARGTFRPNEWWRPFAEAHAARCASRAQAAADRAIQAATDRLSDLYGDPHLAEQSARGAPPETLEVLVERAVTVGRAAMAGRAQALATADARLREMGSREEDLEAEIERLDALDPAAVVRPPVEKG